VKTIEKRIEHAESRLNLSNDLPDIEIIILNSKAQVKHPERYKKVLTQERAGCFGAMFRAYKLKAREQ
jgi:hypothetical protein